MHPLKRILSKFTVSIMLTLLCTPAHSFDPLTLILLRFVRDQMISAGIESAVDRAIDQSSTGSPVGTQPAIPNLPLGMDDTQLRRLIDEGFVHLTAVQRDEVYESLQRILLDPKNASAAPKIIAELALKASAVSSSQFKPCNRSVVDFPSV